MLCAIRGVHRSALGSFPLSARRVPPGEAGVVPPGGTAVFPCTLCVCVRAWGDCLRGGDGDNQMSCASAVVVVVVGAPFADRGAHTDVMATCFLGRQRWQLLIQSIPRGSDWVSRGGVSRLFFQPLFTSNGALTPPCWPLQSYPRDRSW